MKKILTIVLFLVAVIGYSVFSNEKPFEIQRLSVNLLGTAFSNRSIIAYGESCILLRTSDQGKNWSQYHIDDSELNIKKIICQNFAYYGILSKDKIFYSYNDGLNWSSLKLEDNVHFNDMTMDNQNIYILSDSSVLVYDLSYKKMNTITFQTTSKASDIEFMDNHLFVSSDSGKIIDFDIKNAYQQNLIDFEQLGLCSSCSNPTNIKFDNGVIYTLLGSTLIKSADKGNSWTTVKQSVYCYDVHSGNSYSLISNFDYYKNISFPQFFDITSGNNNRISNDLISRYVYTMYYNSVDFVNDYTVIATGNDKLILISTDAGKNWNYVSNINVQATASYWLSKDIGFVIYNKGQIFKTTDGGSTFLPQVYNETAKDLKSFDTYSFDKYGYGVVYYNNSNPNGNNFLQTKDFGNTYEARSVAELIGNTSEGRLFIFKQDSNYLLFYPGIGLKNHMTEIFKFDKDFNITNYSKLDSISIYQVEFNYNKQEYRAIGLERKYPNTSGGYDSTTYYVMHSTNLGVNWIKDINLNTSNLWYKFGVIENNYYILTSHFDSSKHTSIFLHVIDSNNNLLVNNLFLGQNIGGSFFKFGNTLYMASGNNYYFNENYKSDILDWKVDTLSQYYLYGNFWFDNSNAFFAAADNSFNFRLIKISSNFATGIDNTEILKPYLYTELPFPNPTSNLIKCKVYWDYKSEMDNIKVNIYNISSDLIQTGDDISLDRIDAYSGELVWHCQNIQNGVYLIIISIGETNKVIPVIINR